LLRQAPILGADNGLILSNAGASKALKPALKQLNALDRCRGPDGDSEVRISRFSRL
jgi:hypothetical protein